MSRDITTFVDTDGTGYMVSAARENYDLQIYKLTADYTGIDSLVANPWVGGHREAPALFKRNGVYFMLTSAATGWNANQQQYATATSIAGPWTAMTNVGDSTTYNSQTAYVLPLQGTSAPRTCRWRPVGQLLRRHRRRLALRLAAVDLPDLHLDVHVLVPGGLARHHRLQRPPGRAPPTTRSSGGPAPSARTFPASRCGQGVAISQYTCNGGTNQKWWFKDLGTGYYELMGRAAPCASRRAPPVSPRRTAPAPPPSSGKPDHVRQLCARQGPGERQVAGRVRVHRQLRRDHHVHLQRRDQPAVDAGNMTSGQ